MAILAECPSCHRKQSLRNRVCYCGKDLVKAKRSNTVQYSISYWLPGGKQKRELIGSSLEKAKDAEGKRRSQKREGRIFEITAEAKMTFKELTDWYLSLEKIKRLRSYETLKFRMQNFDSVFGGMVVGNIKPMDLENYQSRRKSEGKADQTVDEEIGQARAVINKAFDNDMVGGEILKVFRRVKKLLKRNSNARKKILSLEQFNKLMEHLPLHTKWILATGFFTGMRLREIVNLIWEKISLKDRVIRLEADDTKDKEPRIVPICDGLYEILKGIPRAIHDDHVFLYRGRTGKKIGRPVRSIRRSLTYACKKAGIPYGRFAKDGFIFHDLRHTFNTNMRKAGVQESVIMDITGHSTREMFDRYNTVDIEDRREAVRKLEGFLTSESANIDKTLTNRG
jgi:integrase